MRPSLLFLKGFGALNEDRTDKERHPKHYPAIDHNYSHSGGLVYSKQRECDKDGRLYNADTLWRERYHGEQGGNDISTY